MKQIKLFDKKGDFDLQKEVNDFIREVQEINLKEIVDIRYKIYVDNKGNNHWTAMVIYEIGEEVAE